MAREKRPGDRSNRVTKSWVTSNTKVMGAKSGYSSKWSYIDFIKWLPKPGEVRAQISRVVIARPRGRQKISYLILSDYLTATWMNFQTVYACYRKKRNPGSDQRAVLCNYTWNLRFVNISQTVLQRFASQPARNNGNTVFSQQPWPVRFQATAAYSHLCTTHLTRQHLKPLPFQHLIDLRFGEFFV